MIAKNSSDGPIGNIKADVKNAGNKVAYSPIIEVLTRLGYGVRGLIYFTMGLLALNVALGKGGAPTDQQGAIAAIGRQPAGMLLLWVVLIGLVSYSLWGVIRAVFDPLHKGHDIKGLVERFAFLVSAFIYGLLIMPTYGFITDAGNTAQNGSQLQKTLASTMSTPGGRYLVGIIGLIVIAVGLYHLYHGFNRQFEKHFQTYTMTARQVKWATLLGRIGTITRGVIFAMVGASLCLAAVQSNSSQAVGFDAALATLLRQPFGVWLLGVAAVGLMAFGVYSMLSVVWFRLKR